MLEGVNKLNSYFKSQTNEHQTLYPCINLYNTLILRMCIRNRAFRSIYIYLILDLAELLYTFKTNPRTYMKIFGYM